MEDELFNGSEDTLERQHEPQKMLIVLKTHSGLDDVVSADRSPFNGSRIALREDGDGLALNVQFAILGLDSSLESAVDRVVFEHVDHVLKVDEGTGRNVSKRKSTAEVAYSLTATTSTPCTRMAFRRTIRPIRPGKKS